MPGDPYLNVVATGDFDRNGWTDVVAASTRSGTVAIYMGGASGLAHTQTVIVGGSPRGLAVAELSTTTAWPISWPLTA